MQDYCSVVLLGDCVLLHMISVSIVSFLVPLAKTEPLCILSQIWENLGTPWQKCQVQACPQLRSLPPRYTCEVGSCSACP